MGPVVGDLLPLALGVAISPVPVMAVILMLLAPHAGWTSAGFLLGWVVGSLAVTVVVLLIAGGADLGSTAEPSLLASWVRLILGAVLLFLGTREWRSHRPERGEQAPLPKWMSAMDTFTPAKGSGLGLLLSAANPKNATMCVAAGVAIAGGNLPGGQQAVAVAVFTVLAASTVAVPVLAYAVAAKRMIDPLNRLKSWLQWNNATVMSVLLLVIGVVLLGKGLGDLL